MVVHELPVPLIVDLVNGWASTPRARAGGRAPASMAELLRAHDVPAELAELVGDDAELERIADLLQPVFADHAPARTAAVLSALLAATRVRPALTVDDDGGIRTAWEVPDLSTALLAAAAVTLRSELAARDAARFGTCAAHGCGDVYVDTSPGARRRFCSVTCQNRERVAAFRRRRAAGVG
jgi:predicted RNA-binding Zn ribbon-like protein